MVKEILKKKNMELPVEFGKVESNCNYFFVLFSVKCRTQNHRLSLTQLQIKSSSMK